MINDDKEGYRLAKRISIFTLVINMGLAIVKILIGIIAGSTAMIADGLHSGSDMISTITVIFGMTIAGIPADKNHPYGHEKAEPIAAKIIAIIMILTGLGITYSSINLIMKASDISPPENLALYAAIVSIIIKEWMYRITAKVGKKINSTIMIADAWHHRSDAITSLAALIGIAGAKLGWTFLDPLAGIVVAGFIIKIGVNIYIKATSELMDTAADSGEINKIASLIKEVDQVISIQNMNTRIHGSKIYVDVEICVDKALSVYEGHEIAHRVRENILKYMEKVKDVLVHVNPCGHGQDKKHAECQDCKDCLE